MPCKTCETTRKDRLFIRGTSDDFSESKLLVDRAGISTGGKLLSHSPGIFGASEILHSDESRYLITDCASRKKFFTVRLDDDVYVEKIALVSLEFFAATFRHLQILGSQRYPTSEWRLLGEIETDPLKTHEWFDISESSKCPKCFVRYLKIRVLTHHTIEGFSKCALTRLQVFGNTMLQSLDKLQATKAGEKPQVMAAQVMDRMDRELAGELFAEVESANVDSSGGGDESEDAGNVDGVKKNDGGNPLLKFIEDMTDLQKNYVKLSGNLATVVSALHRQDQEIHQLHRSNGTSGDTLHIIQDPENVQLFIGMLITIAVLFLIQLLTCWRLSDITAAGAARQPQAKQVKKVYFLYKKKHKSHIPKIRYNSAPADLPGDYESDQIGRRDIKGFHAYRAARHLAINT